jgi:hypothetical protein
MKINKPSQRASRIIVQLWRSCNTTILLVALLTPWFVIPSCNVGFDEVSNDLPESQMLTGYQVLHSTWLMAGWSIRDNRIHPITIFLGLVNSILFYVAFNTYKIISPNSNLRLPLFLTLGLSILWFASQASLLNGQVLWGYWIICGGIFSSFILEIADDYLSKNYFQRSTNRAPP